MKKLISKDKNQICYLLDNGLTEVTYLKQKLKSGKPWTFTYASYWHPHELRHELRDFASNSPLSYIRLGKKLNALGLCIPDDDESWNMKKILNAMADNISMNAKPWKCGMSDDDRTVKQIYKTREGYRKYLFKWWGDEEVRT